MTVIHFILHWMTPAVAVFATIEAAILWAAARRYPWRAYLASMTDMLMRDYVVYAYLGFGLADPLIGWTWRHRLTTVPLDSWSAILLLIVGQDFCYYWFHRASHRIRFFWLSHAVHHSSNELNFAAAFRIGWTSRLIGTSAFFLPMIWLGFRPGPVFITLNLGLLYQFFLHSSWAPKLGPLEWVLNTPSHHRVHHAANPEYLDKNYGGILIVFDRLFGTFAAEREAVPCRYGLVTPLLSNNPVRIAFHEYLALARDLWQARRAGDCWRAWFAPPKDHGPAARDCAPHPLPAE